MELKIKLRPGSISFQVPVPGVLHVKNSGIDLVNILFFLQEVPNSGKVGSVALKLKWMQ